MKYFRLLTLMLASCVAASSSAFAHALLLDSSPAANATITEKELALQLRFNSRIDHVRSKLTLFSPAGKEETLVADKAAPADSLRAVAKDLTPGAWRLRWQVLSVDGHITRGDIPFTVR